MKKTLFCILAIFCFQVFCFFPVQAAQVTLTWDANDPSPDGYAVFERNHETGGYDYMAPIWPTDGTDHTETGATVQVSDNAEHAFVCRAYVKKTALDGTVTIDWSGVSNEVTVMPEVPVGTPQNLVLDAIQYLSRAIDSLVAAVKKLE